MREAVRISEKVYGKEHPDYALKLNSLAELLRTQVRLAGFYCCSSSFCYWALLGETG